MELSDEEKLREDILFQIDMQLYDEFNDKLCEINEHLGDIYTYKDLQDIKEAEKEKERSLLRKAIKELQKEIEELKLDLEEMIKSNNHKNENWVHKNILNSYISRDKVKEKKKWYEDTCKHLSKNGIDLDKYDQYQGAIELCEELLEEE